jgi:hypothetical protein
MALKKMYIFQKDNCERIVDILQKLLYNTRPLGPLLPRHSPVLFDPLCELVSQNLWLGSKAYPNGLLLYNTISIQRTLLNFVSNIVLD